MKIAVTDACIFIDLMELNLISAFFQLKIELHTTVDVLNELFLDQRRVLEAYQGVDKLQVHNLRERDFLKMEKIPFPRGLSPEDRSVIYLALELNGAIILSSDKLVRNFSGKQSLEYHGIFWIFDQLVEHNVLSKPEAISTIQRLNTINNMYNGSTTRKEIDLRIRKWGRK